MMWHGIYKEWHPLPDWSNCRVEVDSVKDDGGKLRILITHHDPPRRMLTVSFSSHLLYASSDESDRIGALEPPQPKLQFPHVFWRVNGSELLELFHRSSCGIHDGTHLTHYAFLSCNQCVDVISQFSPDFSTRKG